MLDDRSHIDLLPLKLVTEVLVKTAWQPKLEDAAAAAAQGKALTFWSYRGPISYFLKPTAPTTPPEDLCLSCL